MPTRFRLAANGNERFAGESGFGQFREGGVRGEVQLGVGRADFGDSS
jgi:hypothetical protein